MSPDPISIRVAGSSPEKKVSAGIDRAYQIYGPNLAAFFNAVKADIKMAERKGVQMDLPLMKSK